MLTTMHIILAPLISITMIILDLYIWALITLVLMNWLVAFNVVNVYNRFIYVMGDFLHRMTEPALCRIRWMVPVMGGIDLSPMVLILVVVFLKMMLQQIARHLAITPG